MYGCESWTIKKGWMLKNWCFWTVKLAKTLESPLDCKKIKPVNPKGNQSWIFIGRTDAEAGAPIFWLPDAKTNKQKTSSLEKILMLEKLRAGGEGDEWQRMRWLEGITYSMNMSWASSRRWWRTEKAGMQSMGLQRIRHDWATEQQQICLMQN